MADEKKTYTLTTATVPSRPRSKTRREGEGLTTGGASAIVESATAGNAQRAAHSETANEAAHAAEAAHALNADNAKNATHADEATHAAHAETATSATTAAHSNTADTATRAQSAQTADHAATAATAERATHATEAETLRTPNFADGLNTGAGARIDATGNAEFQSMAVRGFFRAAEYQINRIALSEGDVFHTENGLVKSAEQQSDGRWKVVLQERFQGDVTGFRAGDVLRGAYNSVGTSGGAAEIRTSWLRVEAVDAKAGTLTASLYADNQTPEGRNAPPVPLMRLARWGNTTDPERQSHIVESATEGRIVRRVKVSAPIVDGTQSDGFVVGKLPAWLREHFGAAVAGASDYVFARGIITQNILRYTPAGRPLAERVDRGLWSASARYFYEQQNPQTGAFEISRVWHEGALYELARRGNGNTAPAANSTRWTLIQAKPKDGKDGGNYKTNLIDNSSFQEGIKGWDSEQIKGVFEDGLFSPVVGTRAIKFEVKSLREHDYAGISQELSSYDLPPNTICTLSVWVRATSDLRQAAIIVAPNLESRPWAGKDIVKGQKGWQRNVLKFTTPRDVGGKPIRVYMLLFNQEENATVWFAAPKLEIGDTPTEWTTSENDRKGERGADAEPTRPNLLDDTDFLQLGRKESAWKIGTHGEEPVAGRANISLFSSAVDGCVPALCAINPGTKEGEYAQLFQNVGQLIPGRTYTFSAYVRGADVAWLIVYPTPAEHFHPNTVKQDGWTRVSLTFRAPAVQDPDGVLLLLRAWHRETTPHTGYAKSVVWCAPKLEEGGGATQWCPSFRDQRGADGAPGVRGAAVRLLGDYDRLADGTTFESGHAGETYLDVVQVRQGEQVQFYQCKQPHAKSADKAPAADSEWWELGMYQGFVATDLLLARRSLIKNLQVENVVGRDERGNATFELDAATGTAYIGGTATFAGFIRRRPVVITPENWKEYGGQMGRNGDVFYLNPFAVGTYVIFRGDFGALRPTIDTSNLPLAEGREELAEDNSHLMRYYGAQFMVFNDTPSSLFIGGVRIDTKDTAVFTMLGRKRENPTLWWKGEIVKPW